MEFTNLYHHLAGGSFNRLEVRNGKVFLTEFVGDRGWYCTSDFFETQQEAFEKLQLFSLDSGRYRCKIDTPEVKDNLKLPKELNNQGQVYEPLARSDPGELGGSGVVVNYS